MSYTVNAVSFNYLWSEASILGGGGQSPSPNENIGGGDFDNLKNS